MAARDAERRLLAREIHDELGAELTALRYALARVEAAVPTDAAAACAAALAAADTALDAAFAATYRLIQQRGVPVRPDDLDQQMRAWIASFAERVGLHASFDYRADPALAPLDDARALALLRITQEALNNVARHARASAATVRVDVTPAGATLVIRDNGRGIEQARAAAPRTPRGAGTRGTGGTNGRTRKATRGTGDAADDARRDSHGLGLAGMRERCDALGGRFTITNRPGGGVELRASLPGRPRPPASPDGGGERKDARGSARTPRGAGPQDTP